MSKLKFCGHQFCNVRVARGNCPRHAREARAPERRFYRAGRRPTEAEAARAGKPLLPASYDSREWRRRSRRFLAANPFCIDCVAGGNPIGLATETDHEVPHRGDPVLFWDETNWRPRCHEHHSRKTAREVGLGSVPR
jgi:5-methylcytosine-specific restriction enzyme A